MPTDTVYGIADAFGALRGGGCCRQGRESRYAGKAGRLSALIEGWSLCPTVPARADSRILAGAGGRASAVAGDMAP